MRWTSKLRLRARSLFQRGRVERELDEEIRYHLEHLVDDKRRCGPVSLGGSVRGPSGDGRDRSAKGRVPRRAGSRARRQPSAGRDVRAARASKEPRLQHRRDLLARPGHWREHDDLHLRERGPAQTTAVPGLRPAGRSPRARACFRRAVERPSRELRRVARPGALVRGARARADSAVERDGEQRGGTDRPNADDVGALPGVQGQSRAGTRVHRGGDAARARSGRHPRPRLLATLVRGRPGRPRTATGGVGRVAHDRRRRATRFSDRVDGARRLHADDDRSRESVFHRLTRFPVLRPPGPRHQPRCREGGDGSDRVFAPRAVPPR